MSIFLRSWVEKKENDEDREVEENDSLSFSDCLAEWLTETEVEWNERNAENGEFTASHIIVSLEVLLHFKKNKRKRKKSRYFFSDEEDDFENEKRQLQVMALLFSKGRGGKIKWHRNRTWNIYK